MDMFLSRLLDNRKGTCNSPTSTVSPTDELCLSIVDDNARLPHYTLRAQAMARISPEESERMSIRRWVGSIESTASNSSTSSSAASPFRGLHEDFNDSTSSLLSNCQPICPQRRPSVQLECDSARAAHIAMRELLLADEFSSDEDE